MRNILLATCIALSIISCSDDKDKIKVETALTALTKTESSLNEIVELINTTRDQELSKLDFIDVSEENMESLDAKAKERMSMFKTRIDDVKAKYNVFKSSVVAMQNEIKGAIDEAKFAQQKVAEGKSIDDIADEINTSIFNVDQLDESIDKLKTELETLKGQQATNIGLIIEKYNQTQGK